MEALKTAFALRDDLFQLFIRNNVISILLSDCCKELRTILELGRYDDPFTFSIKWGKGEPGSDASPRILSPKVEAGLFMEQPALVRHNKPLREGRTYD